jgi:glycosyltransferase involved in cell wall biosynthesis
LKKFSIVVGYRNRELSRVKRSLDSLSRQSFSDFELIFVDYGSDINKDDTIQKLTEEYSFVKYLYSHTQGWFWNRAHALNSGVKISSGELILFFDIDLILEKNFLQKIALLDYESDFYTFSCFYLPAHFDLQKKNLEQDGIHYEQNYVGLCAVTRTAVNAVKGFDEYYMVWGVEDDDFYKRLGNFGIKRFQMQGIDFRAFHQWHPTQAPCKPTAWYLLMVNHLFSEKQAPFLNNEWGKCFSLNDRPVLKYLDDKSYNKKEKLDCWADQTLMFFNPAIAEFHKLKSGEVAYFDYTYLSTELKKSRHLPFFKKNITAEEKISKKDISQLFQFFIGSNRALMQDYYYEEKGDRFLFVCIKK